jgi:hypothetical protein
MDVLSSLFNRWDSNTNFFSFPTQLPRLIGLQRIVLGTAELEEGSLYPMVKEADTVTLLVGIDGGMRAKWRKKRMRRLRRKRRKMRARAR